MTRAIRAEVLKLVSVRTTWALLGGMVLVEALFAGIVANVLEREDFGNATDVFVGSGIQTVIIFCLGALMSANEFRHGTANSTFLVTPQRERVVIAKLVVGLIVGLAAALLFIAVNAGFGYSILSSRDVPVDGNDAIEIYTGVGIGIVLTLLLGIGLGALLRNQVLAIVSGLVIFFVLRGVSALAGDVGFYFPAEALISLQGPTADQDSLRQVAGGFLFLAYCAVAAVAGTVMIREREIT